MNRNFSIILASLAIVLLVGCNKKSSEEATSQSVPAVFEGRGVVVETMNAAGYTYACIEQDGKRTWVAGPQTMIKVGDKMDLPNGSMMSNFHSKTLNRTFDLIIFAASWNGVQGTFPANHPTAAPAPAPAMPPMGSAPADRSGLPPGHP